jgi:hypothetical protein
VVRNRSNDLFLAGLGTVFFGFVIGGILSRTLRLTAGTNLLSAIAIIIVTVGGAAVITLLKDEVMCGWYAIGLVIGFLVSFLCSWPGNLLQAGAAALVAASCCCADHPPGATPPDVEHGG